MNQRQMRSRVDQKGLCLLERLLHPPRKLKEDRTNSLRATETSPGIPRQCIQREVHSRVCYPRRGNQRGEQASCAVYSLGDAEWTLDLDEDDCRDSFFPCRVTNTGRVLGPGLVALVVREVRIQYIFVSWANRDAHPLHGDY